jgi:hypothetical protein
MSLIIPVEMIRPQTILSSILGCALPDRIQGVCGIPLQSNGGLLRRAGLAEGHRIISDSVDGGAVAV